MLVITDKTAIYESGYLSRYDMECLNLQKLKRCCRPDVTEMDETEQEVLNEIMLKNVVFDIKMDIIVLNLFKGGYICEEIFRNMQRFLGRETKMCEWKINERLMNYVKRRVCFAAFLWALATSGYPGFANSLLDTLEKKRFSTISSQMNKMPFVQRRRMHLMVKQLKYVSDSKTFENPVSFIRRLAIRFKENFVAETEVNKKRKLADMYFAVLAVELDNFSFLRNNFVTDKSVATEIRSVIPFTSNPTMNEALLNGRVAEMTALGGDIRTARSMIQDVITVVLNTEECPESGNLVYLQLNVFLRDYEVNPSKEKKQYYIEMGFNGLRLLRVIDDEFMAYFKISFMLRIIFCALDLSISGRPLSFQPCRKSLKTAQYFLAEVEKVVQQYGPRKTMSYNLAMGRLLHITGNFERAIERIKEAKLLAQKGGFVEYQNINEYEKSLSCGVNNIVK